MDEQKQRVYSKKGCRKPGCLTAAQKMVNIGNELSILRRFSFWNYQVGSQTACFCLMIQFQDVIGKAKEQPFHRHIAFSPGKETAKEHVLLGHGKGSLRLDRAVDPQQAAFLRGDALLHFLPCKGCFRLPFP